MKMLSKTEYVEGTHFVSSNGTDPQAMFNTTVSDATTSSGDLTVVLRPGIIDAIGFAGLAGGTISVVGTVGGETVYDYSQSLAAEVIGNWYDYFVEPFTQLSDVLATDIPPYSELTLTVTITGSSAACGACAFGRLYHFGDTQYGAQVGILDYSTKETDASGNTTLAPGPFSKRITATAFLDNTILNRAQRVLADARGTATFYSFASGTDYEETYTVFGFYRDFSVVVPYPRHSLVSIDIEGLT